MSVTFKSENHKYESNDGTNINWLSVTSLISKFKEPFDTIGTSVKVSKNKKSKWYGMTPEEIRNAWETESKRSTDLGTWFHNQRESDLLNHGTITFSGVEIPIIKPLTNEEGHKIAPEQKLKSGLYPEHLIYLKSGGICGQSDLVEVVNDTVNIFDYKTNKEIKSKGFTNWEGKTKRLFIPLSHLDDCNLIHYTLQLSMYMYMILKHNPQLKPGELILYHITFEEQAKDRYDNPIYKIDDQGNFIVKETTEIKVPYLRQECVDIIKWLKANK